MVQTLGKLSEPWWSAWKHRAAYFEDDGMPRKVWDNGIALALGYPLDEMIKDIGTEDGQDDPNRGIVGILEVYGAGIPEVEAEQFQQLLEQVLRWRPEERLPIKMILRHSWFN